MELIREGSINFDPKIFLFAPSITEFAAADTHPGLLIRPLEIGDFDRGFMDVLGQLTIVGDVSREEFEKRFAEMKATVPNAYYVVVVVDQESDTVIASATLVIEYKFIHGTGCRGRIEDVVVDKNARGKKLGGLLNKTLVAMAKKLGVYKLSLECKDSLISFYEQFGFIKDEGNNFLVQRFDRPSGSGMNEIFIVPSNL